MIAAPGSPSEVINSPVSQPVAMANKAGIVVVSHNASTAVRATLASLRRAKNQTPSELLVIDNNSHYQERELSREAAERHAREAGLVWRYVQQERNLGFSGGNNVGIRSFLADETITHICLLNSDVIASDHWLDRLLEKDRAVISPVTNKAESEQCVPVDYQLELSDSLDCEHETLRPGVFEKVNGFSQRWYAAWSGNVVDSDATFFCVLIARSLMERIGLLDETFFPGGFEDDDYCLRVRAAGECVYLARDVFMHHWGFASFGQLEYEYFKERRLRNRTYLEKKHGMTRKARPEKPILSLAQDVDYALSGAGDRKLQRKFQRLYSEHIGRLLAHYDSEFRNLRNMVAHCGRRLPEELAQPIDEAAAMGSVNMAWEALSRDVQKQLNAPIVDPVQRGEMSQRFARLADMVYCVATCNFAMHTFLTAEPGKEPPALVNQRRGFLAKAAWLIRRGLPFFLRLQGIVFFGGYPYPERENDGYFQRIREIDSLFTDRWRVYVDHETLPGRESWFDRPAPKTLVLRVTGSAQRKVFVRGLVLLATLRCRAIYFHSVLRMEESRFGLLMYVPGIRKVLDVHGVVPEEFRFHHDYFSACLYERHERLAVMKSNSVIVVSNAMHRYLQQKYRDSLQAKVIVCPIFPGIIPTVAEREYPDGKPVVVYAGRLQKWQQVPKMVDAIVRAVNFCLHKFYCPDPNAVIKMLPEHLRRNPSVIVEAKTREELLAIYPQCHYGFILREDIVVNHVACPTKLVEYLAMGIVPIVDCEEIGDFKEMGMRYLPLADFVAGRLPDPVTRAQMAAENLLVHHSLQESRRCGRVALLELFGTSVGISVMQKVWAIMVKLLPRDTRRGRFARSFWQSLRRFRLGEVWYSSLLTRGSNNVTMNEKSEVGRVGQCDILVQVDNFLAGGLENIVLDLNSTMIEAGYRVILLVLGESGAATETARRRGIKVIVMPFERATYQVLLRTAQPKLVLSHYSIHGAEICAERGVPLVQVIQNVYMWFDCQQAADFARAAELTTAFVALSDFAKRYNVSRLGIDSKKCVVIPPGIDLDKFLNLDAAKPRAYLRKTLGLAESDFVFLTVGSINHQKNHLSTLRAFREATHSIENARLVILGTMYEKGVFEELQAYIEANGLQRKVLYAGESTSPECYYAMADAFVHSAYFEGGPLSLLEAIAANLPIITTEVGLATNFIGRKGVHVMQPPLNIFEYRGRIWEMQASVACEQELADAMRRVMDDPERPNFRLATLKLFDKRESYRPYLALIRQIVDNKKLDIEKLPKTWTEYFAQ